MLLAGVPSLEALAARADSRGTPEEDLWQILYALPATGEGTPVARYRAAFAAIQRRRAQRRRRRGALVPEHDPVLGRMLLRYRLAYARCRFWRSPVGHELRVGVAGPDNPPACTSWTARHGFGPSVHELVVSRAVLELPVEEQCGLLDRQPALRISRRAVVVQEHGRHVLVVRYLSGDEDFEELV